MGSGKATTTQSKITVSPTVTFFVWRGLTKWGFWAPLDNENGDVLLGEGLFETFKCDLAKIFIWFVSLFVFKTNFFIFYTIDIQFDSTNINNFLFVSYYKIVWQVR